MTTLNNRLARLVGCASQIEADRTMYLLDAPVAVFTDMAHCHRETGELSQQVMA